MLKCCADLLSPFLSFLFNMSLDSGCLPDGWKKTRITPVLKKSVLDNCVAASYRPTSKLPVVSKILEKIVAPQLLRHVSEHHLVPSQQSAYRPKHSTETAILKVTSDILLSMDKGNVCLMLFLDLSSAFDCVNHNTLSQRLSVSCGLQSKALSWFQSYIMGRLISVSYNYNTEYVSMSSGVPQGSVLGPMLFSLYISDIVPLVQKHDLNVHLYADDVLIYGVSATDDTSSLILKVSDCFNELKKWFASNGLCVNSDKTQAMWCQSSRRRPIISSPIVLDGSCITPVDRVGYLGVIIDRHLTYGSNVSRIASSCFGLLRGIRTIRSSLPRPMLATVIQSLVLSRLDYCISIHAGLPATTIWRLQRVLHAAARLVYGSSRYDHVSPLLSELEWLSIKDRIDMRLGILAYLCQYDMAPTYLSQELVAASSIPGRRNLRSASQGLLAVPQVRRPTLGGRSFGFNATRVWNKLPISLTSAASVSVFKKRLKSFLLS